MSAQSRRPHPGRNLAIRAEPRGIGTARARDVLAREVKLLGALLGQVIVEQEGLAALEMVERLRKRTIAARKTRGRVTGDAHLEAELEALSLHDAEVLIRAFSLYFQLTNLAEEKQRIRRLRQRQRTAPRGLVNESVGAALSELGRKGMKPDEITALVDRLRIAPVLTAHPTEARRRTVLAALRRVYGLLDQLDDPRLTPALDLDVRARLREEISILWRITPIRASAPGPLDEVRSALAFFDESIFVVTPRVYRAVERALGGRGAAVRPFLAWGSWIGGDRDGNPHVTARTTREALRIQSDHVLRAYEAVSRRLSQTITASDEPTTELALRLQSDEKQLPDISDELARRFPSEPFRRRLGAISERLRRTRLRTAAGYANPGQLADELDELDAALRVARLDRVADGQLRELRWQLATFGFHGFSLEVRQHSEVHRATLRAADESVPVAPGVLAGEVLETFRAMADLQAEFGSAACQRYVVSFTRGVPDVTAVLRLAQKACGSGAPVLDVVPLFESADALADCGNVIDRLLSDRTYRRHLAERGDKQEIMLGYSDSTKESGALAAAWMLYQAENQLVDACRRHGVEPTLFHGRGGAIGRGGGPTTRAVLAQAPGSVDGRLKVTEQGEVVSDRYANPGIALRHLEQLTYAALMSSAPQRDRSAAKGAGPERAVMDELAASAGAAYRALVWEEPAFADFFRAATPIGELAGLTIGSRPASRRAATGREWLTSLRAIPWVFAWSQSRANLPGWFGTGTALAAYRRSHGAAGTRSLRALYRSSPFFASVLSNAEMILAKADMTIAGRYASLAPAAIAGRVWPRIRDEFNSTVEQILDITGHARLLDDLPVLQRSIALRNPYVDSLSELQVMLLRRLRTAESEGLELNRLVHLTVSGVAAGLQNTG